MNLYENRILPRVINAVCGHRAFAQQRAKMVPRATGCVLEVGYGSGTNLAWYDPEKVDNLIALDPASGAMKIAARQEARISFPVEHVALKGEDIPLDKASVDTIVVAYTLCTIADIERALLAMKRVLKPEGQLLFMEHGMSPDPSIQRWQERMNPLWGLAFGGCVLTRTPPQLLENCGFELEHCEEVHIVKPPPIPGISLVGFNYLGVARPRP